MNEQYDKEFLLALDQEHIKEKYARITALTKNELPLQAIEGRVTGGSLSVDGTSAIRRTCNLTLVAEDVNLNNFYWGLSNKFKLEIGLKNNNKSKYNEDIIWFKQGIFIITSFNAAVSQNNFTISISGKDKMCLLNGEVAGSLPASVDFGKIDDNDYEYTPVSITDKNYILEYQAGKYYIKNGEEYELSYDKWDKTKTYYMQSTLVKQKDLTIPEIIREAVHKYGQEDYANIIIEDLDTLGLELTQYRGDVPLYLFYDVNNQEYSNMTISPIIKIDDNTEINFNAWEETDFNNGVDQFNNDAKKITVDGKEYTVTKIENGQVCGYSATSLTYPRELISKAGEALTSILDKIKNMLGAFEYFYDVNGKFFFRMKKNYSQISWSGLQSHDDNVSTINMVDATPYIYNFQNTELIQNYRSTPAIVNIKNDFSIWGVRKAITGAEIPIHARYAIAEKPTEYTSIAFSEDEAKNYPDLFEKPNKAAQISVKYTSLDYDWRELLYRMAKDYYKYGQTDEFYSKVIAANKESGLYQTGITGYEIFYEDIQGFWRDLYNPEEKGKRTIPEGKGKYNIIKKWSEDGKTYTEDASWVEIGGSESYEYEYEQEGTYKYWRTSIVKDPSTANFWIDFYDKTDAIGEYSIDAIGSRPKVVDNAKITQVLQQTIPNVIFTSIDDENYIEVVRQSGYIPLQISNTMKNIFMIAASGKSAEEEMNELFNQHTICGETIEMTAVPIYYLEPNSLIYVRSEKNKIEGSYEISRLSIPLTYNGMMNISAKRVFI